MGWFDDQLRFRKESDDSVMNASLNNIAHAVMGKSLLMPSTNRNGQNQ
ncbi:MAG: hypothetical protein Q4C42_06465 [Clostridia bacterium]|nr:hypothetical protein [Clostridia bacterium]